MHDRIKDIAARVKELRELSEVSVASLAATINVSVAQLQAFESGQEDISASKLHEIAQALNVDLSLFLTGKAPRMDIFTVTRAGKGVSVQRRQQYGYQALAANFANKRIEPFLVTVPPRGDDCAVALNSHPGQELNYVLEGTLKVSIHGHEVILNPGDCIYYDSANEHGMVAMNGKPAKFLAIVI